MSEVSITLFSSISEEPSGVIYAETERASHNFSGVINPIYEWACSFKIHSKVLFLETFNPSGAYLLAGFAWR